MSYKAIRFEQSDGVATLTFNRPAFMNAFSPQLIEEFRDALAHIRANDAIRALIFTGEGRGFCAGADLSGGGSSEDFSDMDMGALLETHYNPLVEELLALPVPTVCALNGVAAGAGASIALTADFVIAGRSAYFLEAFVNIGLVPDAGANWLIPKLVGRARALGMFLLGERLPASDAETWGLIWKCVDDENLMDVSSQLAARLAKGPTKTYGMIRQAVQQGMVSTLSDTLSMERALQRTAGHTYDCKEGITAFVEKRPPAFTGK